VSDAPGYTATSDETVTGLRATDHVTLPKMAPLGGRLMSKDVVVGGAGQLLAKAVKKGDVTADWSAHATVLLVVEAEGAMLMMPRRPE
jgi:hypothetical protein